MTDLKEKLLELNFQIERHILGTARDIKLIRDENGIVIDFEILESE